MPLKDVCIGLVPDFGCALISFRMLEREQTSFTISLVSTFEQSLKYRIDLTDVAMVKRIGVPAKLKVVKHLPEPLSG